MDTPSILHGTRGGIWIPLPQNLGIHMETLPMIKKNDGIFSCPISFLNNDLKHGISLDFLKYDLKWYKVIQQVKYFVSTIIDLYVTKQ